MLREGSAVTSTKMTDVIFTEWLGEVYSKRPGGVFYLPSILLLDDNPGYETHLIKNIRRAQSICVNKSIEDLVKPMKVSIINSFKTHIIEQVNKFVEKPSTGGTLTPFTVWGKQLQVYDIYV